MRGLVKFLGLAPPLLALLIWAGAGSADAADKNKCGCYKNSSGTCFCDRGAKCGCPGDCEPKGCEEAREKAIQREIDSETKKAAEADRRHAASSSSEKSSGSGSEKSSGSKSSGSKSSGSGEESSTRESGKSAPVRESPAKKLTDAQIKQLVKLLDAYFAENPDARTRNVEEVRNQLSQSR